MMRVLLYSNGKVTEGLEPSKWAEAAAKPGNVLWIDVVPARKKSMRQLREVFKFDAFSVAATQAPTLLPKLDLFKDYAFLVVHALGYDDASGEITRRELDMFLGRGYLVTVQEDRIPEMDKVYKEALKSPELMERGPDILSHVILDRLIDLAYEMVSVFDDDIEEMEERISAGQFDGIVEWQLRVRRALLLMKKSIGPQRDVLNQLARRESDIITSDGALFFRDLYDRLSRVYDQVDTNRELTAAAAEAYRSMVSLKINEASLRTNAVIERLTLVATVFLPVTAVASWYGMNFEHMPELGYDWSYPFLFFAMFLLGLWLWYSFREEIQDMRQAERLRFFPSHASAHRKEPAQGPPVEPEDDD